MDETAVGTGQGRRHPPAEVWDAVRADYVSGLSAPECCRRHGVGLSGLRARAARESWRRIDQPWMPPNRLDPYDEGLELEEAIGGDLDRIDFGDLPHVARARVARAVLRGDALAALRWRRVATLLQQDDDDMHRWAEEDAFRAARLREARALEADAADAAAEGADPTDGADGADGADGVFHDD